jgi:HK97 family phage major capsid protein
VSDYTSEDLARLTASVENLAATRQTQAYFQRSPSMAARIGQERTAPRQGPVSPHPMLKAALGGDYVPGSFITAISNLKGNPEEYAEAKATLDALGVRWSDAPETAKATLGTTGATGGYVLPNNLVADVVKPAVTMFSYADLVTVRTGVNVRGVDQPFRTGAPARAQFQDWGATKENVNEAYASYTANLGTIARIYDVGKQYLRFSAGAAEQDVMDELTKAMRLGENFYILAGAGTGSVGSGDPTTGIYTALNARPGFKTAFASASNTTVAGSFASACASALKSLAQRSRVATGIVCDAVTLYSAINQGADAAGFWVNPAGGPTGFNVGYDGVVRFWNVPIYADPNFDSYTGTTKAMIAAQWDAFRLYRGMEFRIDSSDQAGTRWDQNLIGYRGEEEIGFHAGTAVEAGAAQLVTAVIP